MLFYSVMEKYEFLKDLHEWLQSIYAPLIVGITKGWGHLIIGIIKINVQLSKTEITSIEYV